MSTTNIEWTEQTWNPIAGCTPVSPGCLHCYAAKMSHRLDAMGQEKYRGLTVLHNGIRTFNGKISFDEAALTIPLKRKKPTMYFVNSMSDLFHEAVPFEFVDKVFAVMALCPRHTFQVLTKRPERMADYLTRTVRVDPPESSRPVDVCAAHRRIRKAADAIAEERSGGGCWREHYNNVWPLPKVWLGTSPCNQATADKLITHLLRCPAAVRFLSVEPLLGPIDLNLHRVDGQVVDSHCEACGERHEGRCDTIDWVIVGGESGPKARPMHPDWVRSLRDQCTASGVAFFFKQWGEWGTTSSSMTTGMPVFRLFANRQQWIHKASTWVNGGSCVDTRGRVITNGLGFETAEKEGTFPVAVVNRVGKKAAGRLLDGREWNELPEVAHAKA